MVVITTGSSGASNVFPTGCTTGINPAAILPQLVIYIKPLRMSLHIPVLLLSRSMIGVLGIFIRY
jgi:hypothetical protein